jgi:hypothetical protein
MPSDYVYFLPHINTCLKKKRNRQIKQPLALGELRIFGFTPGTTGEERIEDGRQRD